MRPYDAQREEVIRGLNTLILRGNKSPIIPKLRGRLLQEGYARKTPTLAYLLAHKIVSSLLTL